MERVEKRKESHGVQGGSSEKKAKSETNLIPSSKDWIPELANAYFANMFPVDTVFEYLGVYGKLSTREICFRKHDGGFLRFQNFHTADSFRTWVNKNSCSAVDIGAIYNKEGIFHKEKNFKAGFRELVFDLDLTDYESAGLLITGCTNPLDARYASGWRIAEFGARVVQRIIKEKFGFEHMCFFFSGRRGWHLHVADFRASVMGRSGRLAIANFFNFLGAKPGSVQIAGFYNNIWKENGDQNAIPDFALDDVSETVLSMIKEDVTVDRNGVKESTFLLVATEQRWFDTDRLQYTMKPLQVYHDSLYGAVLNRMAAADISERFDAVTGRLKPVSTPLQRTKIRWAVIQATIVAWGKEHFQRVRDIAKGLPVKPRVPFMALGGSIVGLSSGFSSMGQGRMFGGVPGAPERVTPERVAPEAKEPMQLKSSTLLISELYVYLLAPRLDSNVTKDPRHLLKAPFSVHPSTGFVCVPFSPFSSPAFVPSSKMFFPTIVADQKKGLVPLENEIQFFRDSFLSPFQKDVLAAKTADHADAVARANFARYWPDGF
jgi:DNA primase catalytic subunit